MGSHRFFHAAVSIEGDMDLTLPSHSVTTMPPLWGDCALPWSQFFIQSGWDWNMLHPDAMFAASGSWPFMQKCGRQRRFESAHKLPHVVESFGFPLLPQVPYRSVNIMVCESPSVIIARRVFPSVERAFLSPKMKKLPASTSMIVHICPESTWTSPILEQSQLWVICLSSRRVISMISGITSSLKKVKKQ